MGKSAKPSKDKVPKITEEEYAAYVNSLKDMSEEGATETAIAEKEK
jgi:hypothetical protein